MVPIQHKTLDERVMLYPAAAGTGVTVQPMFSAAPLIADGTLVALLPDYRPMSLGIWASTPHANTCPRHCVPCWIS